MIPDYVKQVRITVKLHTDKGVLLFVNQMLRYLGIAFSEKKIYFKENGKRKKEISL